MEIIRLLNELNESESYAKFKKIHPDSYFCAGFFVIELVSKKDTAQLDFFIPSKERIAGFEFPISEVRIFEDEVKNIKEQSAFGLKYDIGDMEAVCKRIIAEEKCQISPIKIIAILKEDMWNITCMDNSLGIIRIKINAKSGEKLKFEKVSIFDMARIEKKDSKKK